MMAITVTAATNLELCYPKAQNFLQYLFHYYHMDIKPVFCLSVIFFSCKNTTLIDKKVMQSCKVNKIFQEALKRLT